MEQIIKISDTEVEVTREIIETIDVPFLYQELNNLKNKKNDFLEKIVEIDKQILNKKSEIEKITNVLPEFEKNL